MALSPRTSHTLHQALGDEAAEDVVNWMQRMEASGTDLREIIELNFSRFEARMDAREARMDARMDAKLADLRLEVRSAIAGLDVTLERRFGEADAKLERRFADLLKWSFVFWVGAVGAIAALAGVMR